MKGKEIITQITQETMPDIQQVRELCLAQPTPTKVGLRRLRLSTAAAIVAALFVFATATYAVVDWVYQRAETGGTWDIVILPNDDYGRQLFYERTEGRIYGHPIYFALDSDNMYIRRIDAQQAKLINQKLQGRVFMACGNVVDFDLVVPGSGIQRHLGRYVLDDRGYVLFTADGEPIGSIRVHSTRDGELLSVEIFTMAVEEAVWSFNSTYEEVAAAFGRDIRLPTAHMDRFIPPDFNLTSWQVHPYDYDDAMQYNAIVRFTTRELTSLLDVCNNEMRIFIENARSEDDPPMMTMYYLGGDMITHEIAGIIVYEISPYGFATHFVWEYDGLSYRFNPPSTFMPFMVMDMIRSMIE
ncbi:MAG: hypothetical protein FWC92_02110 [Defluviitaleaceae bacterium]|nr:hypothetical protein [Defluviitaleaceae bacterium]